MLQEFPPGVRALTGLRILNLQYNNVAVLPAWLGECAELQDLDLSGCQVKALPPQVRRVVLLVPSACCARCECVD